MDDLALLIIRLVVGVLVAGHGAQKLFGWLGGSGLSCTANSLAVSGLRPARAWALIAGLSELVSGALTALGLLYPLAPVGILAVMVVAMATVHWGLPIWADQGGAELPLTNAAVAVTLILAGPGRYALDRSLSAGLLQLFVLMAVPTLVVAAIGVVLALVTRQEIRSEQPLETDPPGLAKQSL